MSKQISSAAQRVHEDLPAAKILESGLTVQSAFLSSIEAVTSVVTNSAKIGALASLPVGIVLLISYLHDEGAPLPAADNSIGVLLSLLCVIFLFLTLVLASILLLPTFAKIFDTSTSEAGANAFHRKKNPPTRWQRLREYYLRFGLFLSLMLFVFLAFGLVENQNWHWSGPIIGVASFAFVYAWRCYVANFLNFGDVLQSTAYSLSSFGALLAVIIAIIGQWNPHMNDWGVASLCVGVPLAIHFSMVMLVTHWKRALAVYFVILVVISVMLPGLGFLGGLTLRYIGGGLPVSIRVKAYGRTGTVSGVDEVTGCLVLMTGGDVLIRPTAQILDCKLHPQFMGGQSLRPIATYSRVERYARADVIRVSKFPDSCGTVDGFPIC